MHPIIFLTEKSNTANVMFMCFDLTHFRPMFPYYIPGKQYFWFSGVVSGFKMGGLVRRGLIILKVFSCTLKVTPYSIYFLSVLHQNKTLHYYNKRGQCPIAGCTIGLD